MAFQPKTEPGSPPISASTENRDFKHMSIPELVRVLRSAVRLEEYEKVEEALLYKEAKLMAEIGPLKEKVELERLAKIQAQQELEKKEALCQKGKKAQESYEALLTELKKNGFPERDTVEKLSSKVRDLEAANLKLMDEKKKWEHDRNVIDEMSKKLGKLEGEKVEFEAGEKGLDEIRKRCRELEGANKKNLKTIEELKGEKERLVDQKLKAEAKFAELIDRVVRLEEHTRELWMSKNDAENNNPAVPLVVAKEEVVDVGGSAPPLQSRYKRQSRGAASGAKSGFVDVIVIEDDDDDDDMYISRGTRAQTIETPKRKMSFSDDDKSSSSSSFNVDNLPLSSKKIR